MKLSAKCKQDFSYLLKELASVHKIWVDDPSEYIKNAEPNMLFGQIDTPEDLRAVISQKRNNEVPCISQLRHNSKSLEIAHSLAEQLTKINQLPCKFYELRAIIDAIVFEYINDDIESFAKCCVDEKRVYDINLLKFMPIAERRLKHFKLLFSKHVFRFPVRVFELESSLSLSKNIKLIPCDINELDDKEKEKLSCTRPFGINYYLEIKVNKKCTYKKALELAENARDATYSILKLLATNLSPNAVPLLASSEKNQHIFDFYKFGTNVNDLDTCTTYSFTHLHFEAGSFWRIFFKSLVEENNLIALLMEVSELLLVPYIGTQRVVERVERALRWYGDAAIETNKHQQILKLVSSLESLVNYDDKNDTTEVFKMRVTNLTITHNGLDEFNREKARQLYNARSNIVHGSTLETYLPFCPIGFVSSALMQSLYYFSLFGFDKTNFKKSLPSFIDKIPENVV